MTHGGWGRDSGIRGAPVVLPSSNLPHAPWGRGSYKQNKSKTNSQPLIHEAALTTVILSPSADVSNHFIICSYHVHSFYTLLSAVCEMFLQVDRTLAFSAVQVADAPIMTKCRRQSPILFLAFNSTLGSWFSPSTSHPFLTAFSCVFSLGLLFCLFQCSY